MKKRILLFLLVLTISISLKAQTYHFDVFWSLSYYTTESEATLYLESAFDGSLNINIKDSSSTSLYQSDDIAVSTGMNVIPVSLNSIPYGEHSTVVELSGLNTETANLTLIKLTPLTSGQEVKIDKYNRCVLVDGTPFFPFSGSQMNDPRYMPLEGFNTVFRWGDRYSSATAEGVLNDEFFNTCLEEGLMVVDRPTNTRLPGDFYNNPTPQWQAFFDDWLNNDLPPVLEALKNRLPVIGMMGLDEPGAYDIEEHARDVLRTYHQLNPYHPTMTGYNHGAEINEYQCEFDDLILSYIYWNAKSTRGLHIARVTKKVSDFSRKTNRPFWVTAMSELHLSNGYSPMTPTEQFANTYIMLVHGATGINYFTWPNFHRKTVESFQNLRAEIDILAPALLRRPVKQVLTYQGVDSLNRAVDFSLRTLPDGTPVIILVNTKDYSLNLTCTFSGIDESATLSPLVDRGITTPLRDEGFSETLEPLATRAYKIEGANISDVNQAHQIQLTEVPLDNSHMIYNLIQDSGFENPDYWTINDPLVTFDTINPHSGQRCVKFDRPNTNIDFLSIKSPSYTLQANHYYEFGAWTKQNVSVFPTDIPSSGATLYLRQKSGPPLESMELVEGSDKLNYDWEFFEPIPFRTEDLPVDVQVEIVDLYNQGQFWVDDIFLIDLGPAPPLSDSKNLVPNSSFEFSRLKDWPNRWRLYSYQPWENDETFVGDANSPYRMDTTYAYHGNYSLRIKGGFNLGEVPGVESKPSAGFDAGIPAKAGDIFTISVYMRANAPATPVTISAEKIGSQTYQVGTNWARYSFSGVKENGWPENHTGINIEVDGIAWIDAVQLEQAPEATTYEDDAYMPEYPMLAPTPKLNGAYIQEVDVPVFFSSTGSIDSDGTIISYLWDFGDGNTSTEAHPSHTYTEPGEYLVSLTLTDNDGLTGLNTTMATINRVLYSYSNSTICEGDSILLEGSYQSTSGVYSDSLLSVEGYDSIVITTLSVNPSYLNSNLVYKCTGDSLFAGGAYQTISGIYFDEFSTINGCDSIIKTILVVNPNYLIFNQANICEGDSILLGGEYQTTSDSYVYSLSGGDDCDTIVETTLTVNPHYSNSISVHICEGDSIFLEGNYQTTPGSYFDSFSSVTGCDSLVETSLSIKSTFLQYDTLTICSSDSVSLNGTFTNTPGSYTESYSDILGCDSTIITELYVKNQVFAGIDSSFVVCDTIESLDLTPFLGPGITAEGLWVDVTSSGALNNEILSPNPEIIGNHTFQYITESTNLCKADTATLSIQIQNCVSATSTVINRDDHWRLYPNPTQGMVILEYDGTLPRDAHLQIFNTTGQLVKKASITSNKIVIDLERKENQLYLLNIFNQQQQLEKQFKLIVVE